MILTSISIFVFPPTRSILPSSIARKTLACAWILISPISSRNRIPLSACSNLPILCLTAPVNDPFSCPKSSDSISSCGIAAQFTSTRSLCTRSLCLCISPATNSLPVPFSPVMRIRASVFATLDIVSRMFLIASLSPRIFSGPGTSFFSFLFSFARRDCSAALRTLIRSLSRSIGFSRKSNAPSFVDLTAFSRLA